MSAQARRYMRVSAEHAYLPSTRKAQLAALEVAAGWVVLDVACARPALARSSITRYSCLRDEVLHCAEEGHIAKEVGVSDHVKETRSAKWGPVRLILCMPGAPAWMQSSAPGMVQKILTLVNTLWHTHTFLAQRTYLHADAKCTRRRVARHGRLPLATPVGGAIVPRGQHDTRQQAPADGEQRLHARPQ